MPRAAGWIGARTEPTSLQRPQLGLSRDAEGRAGSDDQVFARSCATSSPPSPTCRSASSAGSPRQRTDRPRWTKDIDVFCRAEDAERALELLGDAVLRGRTHQPDVDLQGVPRRRSDRRHLQGAAGGLFRPGHGRAGSPDRGRRRRDPRPCPGGHRRDEGDGRGRGVAVALVRRPRDPRRRRTRLGLPA